MAESAPRRTGRTLRLMHPHMEGADVAALQRELEPYHPGGVDGEFGPLTAAAAERATWALGYPEERCDGSADPSLLAYLGGASLPRDQVSRMNARAPDVARLLELRDRIVGVARWGIANAAEIHYEERRPIDGLRHRRQLPLRVDCSGFVTLCYAWAGAPDPNGLGYDGQGYTGTLLDHLRPLPPDGVEKGDLVVWGEPPGVHVALVLRADADPLLVSHGLEAGPLEIRFSVEARSQPAPATWLTLPPQETSGVGAVPTPDIP